ncbi:MAG: glycosyltransferase family 39 protein [Mucinivorans sp.]
MNNEGTKYSRLILALILGSILFRAVIAIGTELGNDEVYYRIFALFPSLSYFDHAPMVAWLIDLTTWRAEYEGEIFVRLASIVIGTINTYIIYRIAGRGKRGFIAALLFVGSIYASIIVGTFIMPDTPLSLFWLLTLWLLMDILPIKEGSQKMAHPWMVDFKMILAGLTIGLAMLSKYTGVYLWAATALYVLLYNRNWLSRWSLYVAPVLSLIVFSPVLIWNYQNDFISFTFHSSRVVADSSFNLLYFGREILGGFFYNNPINFVVIICAIVSYIKFRNHYILDNKFKYLLVFSLPLICVFLVISLSRATLPHWAGPAYFALIILAAHWLDTRENGLHVAWASVGFTLIIGVAGLLQINYGVMQEFEHHITRTPIGADSISSNKRDLGRGDVTLDMYGWQQLKTKLSCMIADDRQVDLIGKDPILVTYRWDEAAHLDAYVARPVGLKLVTVGPLFDTHFYESISARRGGLQLNDGAYLVISSRYWAEDLPVFKTLNIDPNKIDHIISIVRAGECVVNFLIYRISPSLPKVLPTEKALL